MCIASSTAIGDDHVRGRVRMFEASSRLCDHGHTCTNRPRHVHSSRVNRGQVRVLSRETGPVNKTTAPDACRGGVLKRVVVVYMVHAGRIVC